MSAAWALQRLFQCDKQEIRDGTRKIADDSESSSSSSQVFLQDSQHLEQPVWVAESVHNRLEMRLRLVGEKRRELAVPHTWERRTLSPWKPWRFSANSPACPSDSVATTRQLFKMKFWSSQLKWIWMTTNTDVFNYWRHDRLEEEEESWWVYCSFIQKINNSFPPAFILDCFQEACFSLEAAS